MSKDQDAAGSHLDCIDTNQATSQLLFAQEGKK